ncbi:glycosyltransferase family 2 protein [Microcella alkaliphila]|uniref:glycosyltransferase family 2 protein n=1 Tax=Microcella alkaliphila TaxID=279828 RepID=UPI003B014F42
MVVPVYGDAPSLLRCVESLVDSIDQSKDAVLFVNDRGPDFDQLESLLKATCDVNPAFRYERNIRNLGFVHTCNRAVFELDSSGNDVLILNSDAILPQGGLDELGEVLHARSNHGAVCARSNNATIASFPFRTARARPSRSFAHSEWVHLLLKTRLPRFTYAPVAMGFCLAVRRDVVDAHGLFDPAFSPGYGEENDFCLRIGRAGWRSVMANRVLVEHEGARSFRSTRRARLRAAHEKILNQRYPNYVQLVREHLWTGVDPVDVWADVLTQHSLPPRVALFTEAFGPSPQLKKAVKEARDLQLTVVARTLSSAQKFGAPESLIFGEEEGRVWDAAVVDAEVDSEAARRACRAAPRLLSSLDVSTAGLAASAIDDSAIRAAWDRGTHLLAESGIPPAPAVRLRTRLRGVAERRAPFLLTLAQRFTSRSR